MESGYEEEGHNDQENYTAEYNEKEEERHSHNRYDDPLDDDDHDDDNGIREEDQYGAHYSDHEEDADDDKKLFVGGLTWDTTDKDLKEYFAQFGTVLKAELKVDQISGRSRGFAFVTFKEGDAKKQVCAHTEHKLNGKRIDPKAAKPRGKEPVRKVFVGGIEHHVKDEDIKEHFEQNFGPVCEIQRPRNKKFCFITFEKEEDAKNAIATAADTKQNISDCLCDVKEATPKEDHRDGRGRWYDDGYGYGPRRGRGPRGRGPYSGWGYDDDSYYDYGDYGYDYHQGYDANNGWNGYNYDYYNGYYNYDPYYNWYNQGYDQSQSGSAGDWNAYWNSQQYYNEYYKQYYGQQGQDQSQQGQVTQSGDQSESQSSSATGGDDSGNYSKSRGRGRGRYHPYQQQQQQQSE